MKSFNIPMLVLGGGGYTVRNVARCWTYETSVLLNEEISNDIPYNDFFEYYAPDFKLHLTPSSTIENQNKPEHLYAITARILQNLKNLSGAPSVQMHPIPPDFITNHVSNDQLEDKNPDERHEGLTKDVSKSIAFSHTLFLTTAICSNILSIFISLVNYNISIGCFQD
jgi:hypothetical protein